MRTFGRRLGLASILIALLVGGVSLAAGAPANAAAAAALVALVGGLGSALVVSSRLRQRAEGVVASGTGQPDGAPRDDELTSLEAALEGARLELDEGRDDAATYERILASMREGVLLSDRDEGVTFTNSAFERLHGSTPGALRELAPAALREAALEGAREGVPGQCEVEVGTPARWLRASVAPVGDDGSILLVLGDITEARRLDKVRRDFVTNASHELKTPAASIQAAAETIRHAVVDDPEVVPRFAEQLEREALRLSRIVADLLDLSRLEAGPGGTDHIELDRLAAEETERFTDIAERAEIILTIDIAPVTITGSEQDLRLLIRNLIDNACRYTGAGGRVKVSVRRDGDRALLEVADTGVGIPVRELPRVFERFYRVDRARSRETGGTGLGLSLVRHIAENHRGTVQVESELGIGSTFTVDLPADPAST